MKHIKNFEDFLSESTHMNEANLYALKIASTLMDMADKNWSLFGITSEEDLYQDLGLQKKYISAVNTAIEQAGLEDKILDFADDIMAELENEGYQHLSGLLGVSGYYGPKYKKEWLKKNQYALHLL